MGFIKNIRNWSDLKFYVFLIAIASSLMIFGYFMYFGLYLGRPLGDIEDWGSFGSYMGSITGLLAFAGVLYTVMETKKETKSAKLDADRREAEATKQAVKREERDIFFKLLELHRDKVNFVAYTDIVRSYENVVGLNAFETYKNISNSILVDYSIYYCIINLKIEDLENLEERFPNKYSFVNKRVLEVCDKLHVQLFKENKTDSTRINFRSIRAHLSKVYLNYDYYYWIGGLSDNKPLSCNGILQHYKLEFKIDNMYVAIKLVGEFINVKFGHILGQYYRNMYYVLDTIDHFFDEDDKMRYFKIYRAQLSRNEILLCLFNAVSFKSSERFVRLLDNNNFFDELLCNDLFFIQFNSTWKNRESEFVKEILNCYYKECEQKRLWDIEAQEIEKKFALNNIKFADLAANN